MALDMDILGIGNQRMGIERMGFVVVVGLVGQLLESLGLQLLQLLQLELLVRHWQLVELCSSVFRFELVFFPYLRLFTSFLFVELRFQRFRC